MTQCTYINANGEQCKANPMKDSQYCFTHNPDTREEHALAVIKGGKLSKRDRLNLPPVEVKTPNDVVSLLEETINGIRSGKIPPNVANTIAYICGHALKAMENANLDQRVEMIESVLFERKMKFKK